MAREFDTQLRFGVKDSATPGIRRLSAEFRRLSQARETLGLRGERHLQREIQRTQAAYQRLARSGTLSASEQVRAYDKMQTSIARLRQEMAGAERQQRSWLKGALSLGSGLVAGAMTLRQPITRQMDYDAHLRKLANFAYRNDNASVREAGLKVIDQHIRAATRAGGGTPGPAMDALEIMLRSLPKEKAFSYLPEVMKNATATGAEPKEMALLQNAAVNFNLSERDSRIALSGATTAAQHGLVDVPLLASAVPRALEAAKSAGFHGRRGYAQTLALFEAAGSVAGEPGEAATNANSLLAELSSTNLKNNAKNLLIRGKGVDIQALMTQDVKAGLASLDTLYRVIQLADRHDPQTKKLRAELANTRDPEKRANLEAAIEGRHGAHVSTLLTNQESRNGFYGYERSRTMFRQLTDEVVKQFDTPAGQLSGDLDFGLVSKGSQFRVQQAENEKLYTTNDAVAPLSSVLGDVAESGARLAQEFPGLTTAATQASLAITALGAAAAVKTGADILLGKGAGATGIGTVLKKSGGKVISAGKSLVSGGLLGTQVGKKVLSAGKGVLTEGLLSARGAALINPVTAGMMAMTPANTVGQAAEMAELARLKRANLQKQDALAAQAEIRRFMIPDVQNNRSSATAIKETPSLPDINVSVTLDGREIATAVETRLARDGRRH
ncbi:MAG: phage tail tape measure protein [Sodalis sp. (in: enterobacteria)]|uniref:phage tail tape measure protein n=1 Tax=Sodalis sp. (in: enterobacteria) TaxID=1898979 RepID=UPI0039E65BBC